jgi:hypothetical protein
MADEAGTVARAYELAGQPLDVRARAAHEGYLESHRRNRHGRVVYEPAAVGIDPVRARAALSAYCDRFGV